MSSPTVLLLAVGALAAGTNVALLPTVPLVPTEAASVASLLTRVVPGNGTLFVDSDVTWLDALLRRLPPGMPRVLLGTSYSWEPFYWDGGMRNSVILLARGDPGDLPDDLGNETMPDSPIFHSRILLVASANSSQTVPWESLRTGAWVVAYPDGSAALLRVQRSDCFLSEPNPSAESPRLLDRWSPSLGVWEAGVDPLAPLIGRKRGYIRQPGDPPTMILIGYSDGYRRMASHKRALAIAQVAGLTPVYTNVEPANNDSSEMRKNISYIDCADVVFFEGGFFDADGLSITDELVVAQLSKLVHAVPVSAGARRHPLQALVAEYPPALWCLTLLAALSVAVVLTRSSACGPAEAPALLRALAPLLAQPPPGRRSHHPLLGAWMLACVVLAAAYQGLLLKML
ncbi:Ionotropic receptor 231, partial [Frankliniella occidentalis]